jgi:hypothetical protein
MTELNPRVRAILDLNVGLAREEGGRHEYDGVVQDLSPAGVAAGLERLREARGVAGDVQRHDAAGDHRPLRERARATWGAGFTLQRFHKALLDLGAPPLGLIGTAIERG